MTEQDIRYEILGVTITREEQEDLEGRIRLFWVLRNEDGYIEYMTKTFEDLVHEMMWATVEHNKL